MQKVFKSKKRIIITLSIFTAMVLCLIALIPNTWVVWQGDIVGYDCIHSDSITIGPWNPENNSDVADVIDVFSNFNFNRVIAQQQMRGTYLTHGSSTLHIVGFDTSTLKDGVVVRPVCRYTYSL